MERGEYLTRIENTIGQGPYGDDWDSLSRYRPPRWFTDAKFGIFVHWGLYSIPAFNNEWYSRNMYIKGSPEFEHHVASYGPQRDFGYKDFIPLFKAERFDPDAWADLFSRSGAKYAVPVAEHHDGFQMYRSELSRFNAFQMGPGRDVLGELREAFVKRGLEPGLSSHRAEHWFFMSHGKEFDSDIREPLERGDFYWPAMPEPDHQDLLSSPPSPEFLEDWLLRCCELVDSYRPRLFYFDWWIQNAAFKPYLKKFAAYYYNRAEEWGTGAVIAYKHDAFMFGCAVSDVERGGFAGTKPYPWQADTAVALNSWCFTKGNVYKRPERIVADLVDTVSKNGCLLLNVGPRADGTIPDEDAGILLSIGDWLKVNGEAIYGTSPWRIFGEGPTHAQEGQFTDGAERTYGRDDIRFTVKGSVLYAIALAPPEDGVLKVRALGEKSPHFHGIVRRVSVLGFDGSQEWERTDEALIIRAKGIHGPYPAVFAVGLD
jgi:alpha-L-fucosidase